ncbi:MAG TPA: hypothetical protein VFK69_09005 [Candidatus Eisenbacteria bacterium]|nr:hypothetical protein [Candidatus Eisenbacteria bacterium]
MRRLSMCVLACLALVAGPRAAWSDAAAVPARPDSTRAAAVRPPVAADSIPRIPERDRVRLAEVFRLADAVQDQVWPGWSAAPFPVLLVTPQWEFLVRQPHPDAGFRDGGEDARLGSRVFYRPRQFPLEFAATFPAVAGVSTIVIGEAEHMRPAQNSVRWMLTVMHEHLHQWQESQPGYMAAIRALHLDHGDSTGMWMLNYAFPYADSAVAAAFDTLCRVRARAVQAPLAQLAAAMARCQDARQAFERRLDPESARYLAFQQWKEGIARYTEYRLATIAANRYQPSARARALEDWTSFRAEAHTVREQILNEQLGMRLARAKRIAVYSSGAADALLLDRLTPGWRNDYLHQPFNLDPLLAKTAP